MATILDKIKLKTGLKERNKFNLSFKHTTTQDFFKPKVTLLHECVPTEKIEINMSAFSRLDALYKPMYGHIQIVNRCFFVPFRTIFEGWNDFIVGNKHTFTPTNVTSQSPVTKFISSVPYIDNLSILDMLKTHRDLSNVATTTYYDFYDSEDDVKYVLTTKGKLFVDILITLGYKFSICYEGEEGIETDTTILSALPLLAYCKIFSDWFSNPQYANREVVIPYFYGDRISLNSSDIYKLLDNCIDICYHNDYFISAWDKPNSPNGSTLQGFELSDTSNTATNSGYRSKVTVANQGSTASSNSDTPVITKETSTAGVASNSIASFSQLLLDSLHRATHYVMRYMASGNRSLDRMFAEYGVKLDSAKLNRCEYIGKFDINFDISDVMQTSPDSDQGTTESYGLGVGNYTGKGLGYNQNKLSFETDEFGFLMIISYAIPNPNSNLYVDGRPRYLQHLSKLDFFHGDFDALGTQPIRADELYGNYRKEPQNRTDFTPSKVFGWTPRYSEYKINPHDVLSGDFIFHDHYADIKSWTMYRRFNSFDDNLPTVHDYNFCVGRAKDYYNIFQNQIEGYDKMNTIYNFQITSWLPMKPLYDIFDFDQEGKDIMMQVGGSKITD